MAKPRWIQDEAQKQKAEKVLSMLLYKIKKGTATDEDRARYNKGVGDLVVYDWGTENYQNHVPNMIADAERRKKDEARTKRQSQGVIAKVLPSTDVPSDVAVIKRPQLTKRPGKFAV